MSIFKTMRQMLYHGWKDKIPTCTWPKYVITPSELEQVTRFGFEKD